MYGGFHHGLGGFNQMQHHQFNQQQHQQAQQQVQHQVQQQPQNMIKCKMVTGIEEVKAMPIEFDGSLNVYVDVANNKIHTKVFTTNGTVDIKTYVLGEIGEPEESKYATVEDFNTLKSEIEELKSSLGG